MDVGAKARGFVSYFTEPNVKKLLSFANIFGIVYFWVVSLLVLFINLLSIIPSIFQESSWLQCHRWFFLFIAFSVLVNYFSCYWKKSAFVATATAVDHTDELTAKGWSHCVPCQQYIPPRAHHCPVCKKCILKRDMHCFFLGVCIGHFNHRYFLVYLFYIAVGALYSSMCFFTYLNRHFAPLFSLGAYNYLFPVVTIKWMFGFISSFQYGILSLFYICLMTGIGCCGVFYSHMQRVLTCQTSHESAYNITTYTRNRLRNLQEVFGRHWWLAFLLPIPMEQTSDGIVWNKPKEIKGY